MDLFLGNIPFKYKESDIHQIFDGLGNVSKVKLTLSNITKQNKGFCFVTMPVDEEAQKAIEALNGKEIDGKKLELVKVEGSIAEWEKKMLRHGGSGKPGGPSNNFSKGGKIKAGGNAKTFGGG
ncbi:MAG TPA: RNA-binding protein, partial [Saprospiraceae bacterium]|nr:RNA-binding protein [Saprospiraceae bacterium]